MLSEIIQTKKEPHDFTYMCNLKDKTNKTKFIDGENKLVVIRGSGGNCGKCEKGVKRHKLLVIK